jgi:MFS family permease
VTGDVVKKYSLRELVRGNVLWLGIVSLFTDFSSEMIYPLLPFFLTSVLGAGAAFLGVVEGVAETTASLIKLASGWISDRARKRKLLVLIGYGLASAVRPLIAIATAPWQILAIRFSDRVGKGIRTAPRDALLAESVDPSMHGAAFGFHRGADHAGAVLGPLVASAILLALPGHYRLVFGLAAVPAVISVLILWARVQERADVTAPKNQTKFEGFGGFPTQFRWFLVVIVLFALGNATDAFLLLRAQQLGVSLAMIPLLWAALHVSKMAWSVPGGVLSDRRGPRLTIVSGWFIYAGVYAAFAAATKAWHVWALFLIYGLYYGLTEAPEKALVAALAPPDKRGAAFGAYHFAVGVAALPASVIFGLLWQRYGAALALRTGAMFALAAVLVFLINVRGSNAQTDDGPHRRRR